VYWGVFQEARLLERLSNAIALLVTAGRAALRSPMLIAAGLTAIAIERSNRGYVQETRSSILKTAEQRITG
jgi:hypothetical protein